MITLIKWLLPSLATLMLASCAGDVMQVMKERNQTVGVLMVKPAPPSLSSGRIVFTGVVATMQPLEVDTGAASTIGVYDNNAKTFYKYGQSVVAKLKAQGIDARLLESYPPAEGLKKDREALGKIINYPAETKKYPLCLVLSEIMTVGVNGSTHFSPLTHTYATLIDPATNEILGKGYDYKTNLFIPITSRAQAHAAMDESSRAARQNLLEETFYQYEE